MQTSPMALASLSGPPKGLDRPLWAQGLDHLTERFQGSRILHSLLKDYLFMADAHHVAVVELVPFLQEIALRLVGGFHLCYVPAGRLVNAGQIDLVDEQPRDAVGARAAELLPVGSGEQRLERVAPVARIVGVAAAGEDLLLPFQNL